METDGSENAALSWKASRPHTTPQIHIDDNNQYSVLVLKNLIRHEDE